MEKILAAIILCASFLTTGTVLASPLMGQEWQTEMVEKLELTLEQQEKFRALMRKKMQQWHGLSTQQSKEMEAIIHESRQKREALFEKYGLDASQFKSLQAELRKVKKEAWSKVDGLLTEEQKASMGQMKPRKAWREAHEHHVKD